MDKPTKAERAAREAAGRRASREALKDLIIAINEAARGGGAVAFATCSGSVKRMVGQALGALDRVAISMEEADRLLLCEEDEAARA